MKKLFGLLVMGGMIAAPMHAMTVDLSKVDVEKVKGLLLDKANEVKSQLDVIVPVFEQLVSKVQKSDFQGLKRDLKGEASKLNLQPAIRAVYDYFAPAKSFFATALSKLQKNPEMISQVVTLSEDQLTAIKNAARLAESNLDYLDVVRNKLGDVATNANLELAIDKIVDALENAANNAEFRSKLNDFKTKIQGSYDIVKARNFQEIANAVPVAVKVAKKETIRGNEVITLAKGLGQVRRLVPALVNIIQQFADFAVSTNSELARKLQMDPNVRKALDEVNKNSGIVFKALEQLNNKLEEALSKR